MGDLAIILGDVLILILMDIDRGGEVCGYHSGGTRLAK